MTIIQKLFVAICWIPAVATWKLTMTLKGLARESEEAFLAEVFDLAPLVTISLLLSLVMLIVGGIMIRKLERSNRLVLTTSTVIAGAPVVFVICGSLIGLLLKS